MESIMSLVYFEDRSGNAVAIVVDKIISLHQNRLPTDTPVCIATTQGAIHVRGSFDTATEKVMSAQLRDKEQK